MELALGPSSIGPEKPQKHRAVEPQLHSRERIDKRSNLSRIQTDRGGRDQLSAINFALREYRITSLVPDGARDSFNSNERREVRMSEAPIAPEPTSSSTLIRRGPLLQPR